MSFIEEYHQINPASSAKVIALISLLLLSRIILSCLEVVPMISAMFYCSLEHLNKTPHRFIYLSVKVFSTYS